MTSMATTGLIRRARELAKLAEKATPGPWAIVEISGLLIHRGDMAYCDESECSCIDDGYIATAERQTDAKLIQAAPDMALLLGQLADELERLRNENARLRGSTFYECPDCGATCMGRD